MDPATASPLSTWHFSGALRTYQAEVLDRLEPGGDDPLHIVAPPGSGKTLLGLLLAAREGHRALVLAPTVTIRQQWLRTATELAPEATAVSDDPDRIADLTVLTYQLLSVTGDGSPFDDLALAVWTDELVASGRTEADAATWLAELAVDNAGRYRSGIRSRTRRLRSRLTRQRPAELARVLHPNAVALIDRLVAAGVRTVVLDECHHLLDHWAIVVAYLAGRIRERGIEPTLIGLTATLPSPDDETEFENYSNLLGEVDYEVPTPAVVKEGHLAPYRDHVLFAEPTPAEATFIRRHESLLHDLIRQVLSTPDALAYLEQQLQPDDASGEEEGDAALARLDRAFSTDFALTRSCALVLREVAPQHPLVAAIPPVLLDRYTTDDLLTVLSRFAHARLLSDPSAVRQWEYVRRSLADFGYALTDRGIRRGRNPVETTLAFSAAKDHAAVEILRRELTGDDGDRIRAVVVTDFVEHGNNRGLAGDAPAGALRTFELLAVDAVTARLRPVLLTSQHVRVRAEDAADISRGLSDLLGEAVRVADGVGPVRDLQLRGAGSGRVVGAVSELIRRGDVRLLVGTRGLLGEGWDCPSVNTLVDLTTVATSSGTQQLRGRTLRLDPAWPEKVAHNWSVVCLIPSDVDLDDGSESARLRRRHSHLWGLSADGEGRIVSGLGHALAAPVVEAWERVLDKDPSTTIGDIDSLLRDQWRPRARTRAEWRIGEPYTPRERETISIRRTPRAPLLRARQTATAAAVGAAVAGTATVGALVAVLAVSGVSLSPLLGVALALGGGVVAATASGLRMLLRTLRDRARPAEVYRSAAIAVVRTLREAGRIAPVDESAITARPDEADPTRIRIEIGGRAQDAVLVADAVEELFAPVRTPRFLLRIDAAGLPRLRALERLADRLSPGRTLLAVPRMIARRRGDAELFRAHWQSQIGSCALHELTGVEGLALLRLARSADDRLDAAEPRARVWG
ncbi:superfamily II DNA or RNA helicase [Microbacterium phyllosphaerae]|uniref:Superfamily II DNA or RNA helicase n=1 Tax=Microbacterium phyllosphaerae TaxID=124798 RepID=A0ABS4WTX0_9MICO|nr:DEAD/DEAH box helicase family protein [Microbacterium phyllosphaerae]MBP2379606.1 superfamily II DNA or RNA helicase [Microbacterium phyllosphaerae]